MCLRFVKMFRCVPIVDGLGATKFFLEMDLSMECYDAFFLKSYIGVVALILGPLTVFIPAYMALFLRHYHQQLTGEVLDDESKLKQGEVLGEKLTKLDTPWMKRTFGLFAI